MTDEKDGRRPYTHDELEHAVRCRERVRNGEAREIRTRHGITLEELAEMVGTTTSTMNRWERGEARIPLSKAVVVMAALDPLKDIGG